MYLSKYKVGEEEEQERTKSRSSGSKQSLVRPKSGHPSSQSKNRQPKQGHTGSGSIQRKHAQHGSGGNRAASEKRLAEAMNRMKMQAGDESEEDDDEDEDEEEEEEDTDTERVKLKQRSRNTIDDRPAWQDPKTINSKVPHPMTLTHINQTKALVASQGLEAAFSEGQSSTEWLGQHSVEGMKLSLRYLIAKSKVHKPSHKDGSTKQHLSFEAGDITEFEYKLNIAIEMYTKRIKWLLAGSKRVFGLVKGSRVAVCIDTSDANCGFGRLTAFQESLLHLIDEQLSSKDKLYLMSFGSDIKCLWNHVRDVNCRILDEAKDFVSRLQPTGGCNLMKAMKQVYKMKDINSIVLILGSVPDQSSEILCDYVSQMGAGLNRPLHTVAYDQSNHLTNMTLRNVADESHGRYHCYTATCEEQIYTGTDISLLLKEISEAQGVINKIKEMRQGMLGDALISVMNEISTEVSKLPASRFLPRPPGHMNPLRLEMPKFHADASQDWLAKHGLKARKLDLYQVLSPDAYSYKEEFIPVIRRTVQSKIHEKAMAQFTWHDGSVRNVHVDMARLFEYQKQLGATVKLYERRVDWLSTDSRKLFGTISEKNIIILIDLSQSNFNYLVHIQHSLRLVFEQQLANKEYFNLIGFGSTARYWKQTMMKPTPENLQQAWKWVLDLQCEGSRNFMDALRLAVENDEEAKHGIEVEGIYLFASGIPDQPSDVCVSYVEEATAGRSLKVHSVLFNVDDYDAQGAIPGRYANITKTSEVMRSLSHCTGGRFHWFRETGIIESDDITALTNEVDKAINFSRKCSMLVEQVKKKYPKCYDDRYFEELRPLPSSRVSNKIKALPPPKQTALSIARLELNETRDVEETTVKAIGWRPESAKDSSKVAVVRGVVRPRPQSAKDPMQKVKITKPKVKEQVFYTEDKNNVGGVINKYPKLKTVRKEIRDPNLPSKEEQMTTKDWLKLYSLSKLKLDLNKLVAGPDCKHVDNHVKSINKNVSAKVCNVFPSINVKGTIKHLQLLPHELEHYEEIVAKVLKRYLKRLQWLLCGSRRVFGTVCHKRMILLIDISGSMDQHLEELKRELASLIWDQLYKGNTCFNLIAFSRTCTKWQATMVPANEENCHDAIRWISELRCVGNTCTLEALDMAFGDPSGVDSIYLLTDGKPDTSTSLVLKEVARHNIDRHIPVNTISFNCDDSTANSFLKLLAAETSGRYHRCHSNFDADLFTHKLLEEGFHDYEHPHLPDFEGDDLRRLGAEIAQCRRFIAQSRSYRALFPNNTKSEDTFDKKSPRPVPFVVSRPRYSATQ
ncbi:unnamed protein product [Owenia fusiformis]|uniref:Uncharacterized protein n=1 Tax=Owenia fusiformis TaxID=6347 RepID=A0A8J1XX11_OWEFU|nr:unnamed protein product [Owenia fusiformis]